MNAVAAVSGAAGAPPPRAAVTQMLDRMPERGVGHRVIVADAAGVIGAAGAAPAFASKTGCALLAGDLRLDNAEELRHTLGLAADDAQAVVAIEAFARWGDQFAAHLVGDFALVLIDRPARRLLAVRDPLGIRPLYYRAGINHVRFASELRALREPGDAADEGYLAEALSGDINDVHGTPYLAIRRVPAGHMAIAGAGGVTVARYWEPPWEVDRGPFDEHAERFRATFDEAVRARCEAETRVGVHLSGGLDSSSVLGTVAANHLAEPIVVSLALPWPEADERDWIQKAASRWSLAPVLVHPAVAPALHGLADIDTHGDLPDFPVGTPLLMPLSAAVRERGAGIVLTGFGGDQWWSGEQAHMADLLRRGHVGDLARWRRAGAGMGELQWSWRGFARDGVRPLVARAGGRMLRAFARTTPPAWIDPGFAAKVGLKDRLRRRPSTRGAPSETWRRLRWRLDSGEEAFALAHLDRLSVSSGVEMRHPFYDRRLVELAFRTPASAHIQEGRSRAVVRRAMAARLDPAVAARTSKAELSPLLAAGAAHPDTEPLRALTMLAELGWIRGDAAREIVRRTIDEREPETASVFWRLVGVEAWLRRLFRP